jgi:PAS domain S-box-containing protein
MNDTFASGQRVEPKKRGVKPTSARKVKPQSRVSLDEFLAHRTEELIAKNAELAKANESLKSEILERERAERALARERLLLRTLIDNLPDAIYAKDTEGRKILANPADLRNLRCKTEAEALGKSDFDLFPPEIAAKFFQDDQAVLQKGEAVLQREEYFLDEDGKKHWLLTSKVPMRDGDGSIVGLMGIGRDITLVKAAEERLEGAHRELLIASRQAGMAEVATGVLHNVGNVLNSVNVSAALVAERLKQSRAAGIGKLANLFEQHDADLARFLTEDERGRQVPAYLHQLAQNLDQERRELRNELEDLTRNVEHIKEIVAMQQNYARVVGVVEAVALAELVDDAIKIHGGAYSRHGVNVVREYEPLPHILVDKHKVLQILVNFFSNAKYACDAVAHDHKRVTVRIRGAGVDRVTIEVEDNGVGIAPENLARVFSQGFTTRRGGHGFGLHSGAIAAAELGGSLTVRSEGLGKGSNFRLELPLVAPSAPVPPVVNGRSLAPQNGGS